MSYQKLLDQYLKRRERIARLLASGMPQAEIARKLSISRQRVGQIVRELRANA